MDDFLEKICVNLGIRLVYTNNKIIVLSAETKNSIPVIRAHKVFRHCPFHIAQTIINYYVDAEKRSTHEEVLVEYLKQKFPQNSFKLKSAAVGFKKDVSEKLPKDSTIGDDSNLIELDIAAMTVKDFWGNEKKYNSNSPLTPDNDDILELNIVIKPPVT